MDDVVSINAELSRMPKLQKFFYGIGHMYNDLCAAMWFSFLLVYFQYVNHFPDNMAGYVLLLGQVVDAIATPIIGYESDFINGCCRYTKRKSWHLLGKFLHVTVLLNVSNCN